MKDDMKRQDEEELEVNEDDESVNEELSDIEENSAQTIKTLKQKLRDSEKEKMEYLENLQRAKADFLNGKRRLEEERLRDRERSIIAHAEKLIPLSDSFYMAKSDKAGWEKVNETWRRGIESIENQLQSILASYHIVEIRPNVGDAFNPALHEAMTNVAVKDEKEHHTVIQVIQNGFMRTTDGKEELIRPARVTVGEFTGN